MPRRTLAARTASESQAGREAWWAQVFAPDVPRRFPRLRLINWFEQEKAEQDVPAALIDWTVTRDQRVLAAFRREMPEWLLFSQA